MPQESTDPAKNCSLYDLSVIAEIRNRHEEVKPQRIPGKQPYEPETFCSAYDLSKRPGDK